MWGDEAEGRWILLDEQYLWIRQNLGQFEQQARRKPHVCNAWLWTHALSIDQTNNSKRNHQMQHMGRIYREAAGVLSWLGPSRDIARYLNKLPASEAFVVWDDLDLCEYW